jgi:hypothetical protein
MEAERSPVQPATYIVDAYNVIRSLVGPADMGRGLETARRILEGKLRAFRAAPPGARVILIYDGSRGAPPDPPREPGLEIRFARPPARADDLVVETARSLEGKRGIHVVSSDIGDIVDRVARLRVTPLSAAAFAALVERKLSARGGTPRGGHAAGSHESKPETIASAEVEDWVRRFGFAEEEEDPS